MDEEGREGEFEKVDGDRRVEEVEILDGESEEVLVVEI